jgi:hypothetical protein
MLKPNFTEYLSDIDASYIAGLLDGEGCISIGRCGGDFYGARLQIKMCAFDSLFYIQQKIGGRICLMKSPGKHRDVFNWYISTKDMGKLLPLLLPYLKVKKRQAELVIVFNSCKSKIERQHLYKQMMALNKTGN